MDAADVGVLNCQFAILRLRSGAIGKYFLEVRGWC